MFEGGLSLAEANALAPFELELTIEAARYRRMLLEEAILQPGYLVARAWIGKKMPPFKKLLGRITAEEYKARLLGQDNTDPDLAKRMRALIDKVDREQHAPKRKDKGHGR